MIGSWKFTHRRIASDHLDSIGESYREGLIEAVMMCEEIWKLLHLTIEDRDTIQLATLLSDIGKFGNHIFREESNQALAWLYSFDTTLKSEAKKSTSLTDFLLPNNPEDTHRPNLERWLREKDISFESADIRSHFDSLHGEEIFRDYATEYTIDYKSISLGQAWSIYHILAAESIWANLRDRGLITDMDIDLARLHHLSEWVHNGKKRDIFLDGENGEKNAKLLAILIIIDKVQALRQRVDTMSDAERRTYVTNISNESEQNLGPNVVRAYRESLPAIVDTYLKRKSDRRIAIDSIATYVYEVINNLNEESRNLISRRAT